MPWSHGHWYGLTYSKANGMVADRLTHSNYKTSDFHGCLPIAFIRQYRQLAHELYIHSTHTYSNVSYYVGDRQPLAVG